MIFLEKNITLNYIGVILYYNPEYNEEERTVILFNISDSLFVFDVAAPAYDNASQTLYIVMYSELEFNFTNATFNQDMLGCQDLFIRFIGNDSFIMFCQGGSYFLMWQVESYDGDAPVSYNATYIDNNTLNISQQLSI